MNIKSLFQSVIYMCIIEGIILDNEWIKPIKNESAIVGCSVELAWELFGDLDVSIYKVSGQEHIKDVMLYDSEKYQLSQINELQYLTISNINLNDAGVYRCKDNHFKEIVDIHLTVTDIKWLNTKSILNLSVGDDATIIWEYFTYNIDKHISVIRSLNSTQDSVEVLGKLEHDILQYNRNHQRMQIGKTESDDGRTEVVMLTIHNTTIDDLSYIYNMKIQFNHNCVKYGEPVSLNEVPRVYSKIPEMIGRPTEDIKFVWNYQYSSPAVGVVFSRYTSGQLQKVGYWNGTRFYSYIGEDRLQFSNTFLSFRQAITLTIKNTTADDFNTIYGCKITFSDGVTGYNETKLLCDRGPRLATVANQLHGKLGDDIMLYWIYTYCPEATDIRFFRIYSSGKSFLIGHWTKNQGYQPIGNNRAVFYQSTVEGKEKITLVILNTDENDYNSTYICEVIFEDISRNLTAIELILIPDTDIESGSLLELNMLLMTVLPILAVLICSLVGLGLGIYGYKRKAKEVVNTSTNPANNMRHSYISLNSVVIFHANHESTTTNGESTASNDTDDDTNAYANPYDPINRAGIDTSKNFYMSLQNPGTSNINQGDDVQETNVDDNSVTNINDVQTADDFQTADVGDDDDDVGDDDTSTHDSNPYDALNKYTMNSDVHSYLSLPPCSRSNYGEHARSPDSSRGGEVIFVKKRPSTI